MLASTVQFSRCGRSRSSSSPPVALHERPVRRTNGPPVPKRRTDNRRRFLAGREGVTTIARGSVPSGPNSVPDAAGLANDRVPFRECGRTSGRAKRDEPNSQCSTHELDTGRATANAVALIACVGCSIQRR
jgi:hypothetical protein